MNHQLDTRTKTLNVSITGDILSTNAKALREELFQLLETPSLKNGDWLTLKLDLTSTNMIDSVGLNLLVTLVRAMKAGNRKIQAVVASPNIQRAFQFTRLDQQIEVLKI